MFACSRGCGKATSLKASADLSGSNLGGFAPGCELYGSNLQTSCEIKTEMDVVDGTFEPVGGSGTWSGLTDLECSAKCAEVPACTAWIRELSTGTCWLTQQSAPIHFVSHSDRNSGLRCNSHVKSEFIGSGVVPKLVHGKYSFTLQDDGNLVLYDGDQAVWASNTDFLPGKAPKVSFILQEDGNMVIKSDKEVHWASHTKGAPGPCKLVLQSDRNVVLYDKDGVPRWSTGTAASYSFSVVGYTHDKDWAGTGRQKCAVSVQFFVHGEWGELRPFITEEVLPLDIVKVNYTVAGSRPTKLRFVNTSRDQIDGWGTTKVAVEFNRRLATCTAEQGPKEYYWVKNDDLVMNIPEPSANDPMFTRPADVPEVTVQKDSDGVKIEKLTAYPYTFTQQADGNICVYQEGKVGVLWASGTVGRASANHELIMQGDGNLVSYANGKAVWESGTSGSGPFLLVMQLDGNVVLYSNGQPLWNTGTRQG